MPKRWKVAEPMPTEHKDRFPEINPVTLQLLWNRGITTQEEIDIFLGPDYSRDILDPFLFNNMKAAVERLFVAIENDEVISVHGDYDADGVCGSSVLFVTIKEIGELMGKDMSSLNVYIPHREKEGYGLFEATVDHLHKNHSAKLIVTVDCGISNLEPIAHAKELGIDTIVCDHHDVPETQPEAIIIHPKLPNETYPNKDLAGAGVAFKFATALITEARNRGLDLPEGHEKWLLDLVAIATVTDIMKLTGENRVLEMFGLLVLNKTRRPGLEKLIEIAGLKLGNLQTWNIGWQIGPRINAAGRINHASDAFELLVTESEQRAAELANKLNEENKERQKISEAIYWQAVDQVGPVEDQKILFAVGEDWPPGIVGLVAGKLSNEHYRPAFVISKQPDKFVGSGRSIPEFNVVEAMNAAAEHLDRFGGHPQACGLSIVGQENLDQAIEIMTKHAEQVLEGVELTPSISIEAELTTEHINWKLVEDLEKFRPFGTGNEQPVFVTKQMQVVAAEQMGADGKHMRLTVNPQKGGKMLKLVGFRLGYWVEELNLGDLVDIVYDIGINEWNGNREIQLKIIDIRKSK